MDTLDCVVIGAGVVGLAIARALALAGREVVVLEAASGIGCGISSRNSEVIHAGLYYPPGSLKARLCRRGNALLYAYCSERSIEHRRCGKLVLATEPSQVSSLSRLFENAITAGASELEWLDRARTARLEPQLQCAAAFFSPASGIVDSHALMLSLQGDAEAAGAAFAFRAPVVGGRVLVGRAARGREEGPLPELRIGGGEPFTVAARCVINCAGLDAQSVARALLGMPAAAVPEEAFARGCYFSLAAPHPFSHLIYPLPEPGGLGIHLTLDLAGRARFGPDVEWIDAPDYRVDAARGAAFATAIRRYWPGLPDAALQPDYAGVRPKLREAGAGFSDFIIAGPNEHGVGGLYHLFAIESPGLTAALALGEWFAANLGST
jgi:D-amino-acid oxidase